MPIPRLAHSPSSPIGGEGERSGAAASAQDDPSRHDYNVDRYVDEFVQHARDQAAHTQTEHQVRPRAGLCVCVTTGQDRYDVTQMWACGSDFQFQNADLWYAAHSPTFAGMRARAEHGTHPSPLLACCAHKHARRFCLRRIISNQCGLAILGTTTSTS